MTYRAPINDMMLALNHGAGLQAAVSVASSILGGFLGRKSPSVGSISTAARGAGRVVQQRDDVKRVVRESISRFGHIDVWVNNVGQGITRAPSQLTDEDIDNVIRINIKSAIYGMQEILPHFRERNAGQVINVSSMLGRIPFAVIRSAYNGAKHFLNAITANFRTEVQETHPGIQFTIVSPGVVRTEFGKNALHGGPDSRELPQSQSAEDVAEVIAGVMESRLPDIYTRPGARERVIEYYSSLGVDPGV